MNDVINVDESNLTSESSVFRNEGAGSSAGTGTGEGINVLGKKFEIAKP